MADDAREVQEQEIAVLQCELVLQLRKSSLRRASSSS